jgi:hypothetical protein
MLAMFMNWKSQGNLFIQLQAIHCGLLDGNPTESHTYNRVLADLNSGDSSRGSGVGPSWC